eukprot:CAMPEP_0182438528 /NCGR_PEP_ID=MMETSP1167-20130531/85837_1 /TAXON_ID=2988 /ORGANISM="Mallomonas Sp, Strain CCMP3275" /LENGTH=300 /DNA_ID=CAMNT_0024631939 /DNA_START=240 /DNA_END=1142 /DNA_ORIENTATION=+
MSGENTEPFLQRQKSAADLNDFPYSSSLTWFYDAFYDKFFELCPETKVMFERVSMIKQGRLIAGVISSALDSFANPEKLKKRLVSNTKNHNGKGIKSEHYVNMGEALVSTLEMIIGPLFDAATKDAWYRIYSYMLNIILPVSVEYEVEEKRKQSGKSQSGKYSISSVKEFICGSSGRHSRSYRTRPRVSLSQAGIDETHEPQPQSSRDLLHRATQAGGLLTPMSGSINILLSPNLSRGMSLSSKEPGPYPEKRPSLWSTKRLDEFFVRPLRASIIVNDPTPKQSLSKRVSEIESAPKCPF